MNEADFKLLNIDTQKPGFYNDPNFLKIERANPEFLNEYNDFVLRKNFDEAYLDKSRKSIRTICEILYIELKNDGREGACIDICQALTKILEKENIWCCMFSGAMTLTFSKITKLKNAYYWPIDKGNFSAAHTWVSAPPFSIIDLSISLQHYKNNERNYLPNFVLEEKTVLAEIEPIDLINPEIVPFGMSMDNALASVLNQDLSMASFIKRNTALSVSYDKCKIKYIPTRSNASDGNLEDLKCISFSGRTTKELYKDVIKHKLSE